MMWSQTSWRFKFWMQCHLGITPSALLPPSGGQDGAQGVLIAWGWLSWEKISLGSPRYLWLLPMSGLPAPTHLPAGIHGQATLKLHYRPKQPPGFISHSVKEAIPIQGCNEVSRYRNEDETWPVNPWKVEIGIGILSDWPCWMFTWFRFLSKPFIWCLARAFIPKSSEDKNNRTTVKIVIIISIYVNNIRFLWVQ